MEMVKVRFEHGPAFEKRQSDYVFKVGEHPSLWKDGRYFRRFSSKISGSCGAAEPYI